jgi:hypothetical protein
MTWLAATNWRETKGKQTEVTGHLEECHSPETISDPTIHFLPTHTHIHLSFLFFLFSFLHFLTKFSQKFFQKNGIFQLSFRPYLTPFWFLAKGSLAFVVFVMKKIQFWGRETLHFGFLAKGSISCAILSLRLERVLDL